jgi:hypothetical protein
VDDDFDPQRATKVAAIVSMGSLLALVGLFSGGGHAAGAQPSAAADSLSRPNAAQNRVLTVASAAPAAPAVVAAVVAAVVPVAVTTTTTPITTTTAHVCTSTYIVQRGDFWLLLAGEASVSVDQLYAANGAGPSTALFPGQTICLPDGASVVTTSSTSPPVTAAKPAKPATTVARPAAPVVTAAHSTHSSK